MPIDFPEQLPLDDGAINTALARIKDPSPRTRFYLASYPILLSVVASLNPSSRSSDVVLAHLAYAWMPAALKATQFNQFNPHTLTETLANLNKTNFLTFISDLTGPPINDSWVGSSKTFHLVKPDLFPIWDRRVASKLGARHRYELENQETYRLYTTSIHRWAAQHAQLRDEVSQRLSYSVSPVRSIELLLFV